MLSRSQLGKSRSFRVFAYILIFGFSFLLFLPASLQLGDLFFKRDNHYIQVNDQEVFFKEFPISDDIGFNSQQSIANILKILIPSDSEKLDRKWEYQFLIKTILSLEDPKSLNSIQMVFYSWITRILGLVAHLELANQLDLKINSDDLKSLVEKTYKEYLAKQYQQLFNKAKQKDQVLTQEEKFYLQLSFSDYLKERYSLDWNHFYKWGVKNLKERYLISLLDASFSFGNLTLNSEVKSEFSFDTQEIKVEYLFYSHLEHVNFLKNTVQDLDFEAIKNYYTETAVQYIDVKYIEFSSKEKAAHVRSDAKNFLSDSKFNLKEERIYFDSSKPKIQDLFKKLVQYSENSITDVLENFIVFNETNPYAVYKIIKKSETYQDIEKDIKNRTSTFLDNYFINKYPKFKDSLKERISAIKDFIKKNNKGESYKELLNKYKKDLAYLNYGKTKFFNLNSSSVELDETNQADKKINSLIFRGQQGKGLNVSFFKTALSLKNGEQSEAIEFEPNNLEDKEKDKAHNYIFFIKKVDEKSTGNLNDKKYFDQVYRDNEQNLSINWLKYLLKEKIIKIDINFNNIFQYYNLL